MRRAGRWFILSVLVTLLGASCGGSKEVDEGKMDPDQVAVFGRLLAESKQSLGDEYRGRHQEIYDCVVSRAKSDLISEAGFFHRLKRYYDYLDAKMVPPPAELPQLEGAVLYAQEKIRLCKPRLLQMPAEMANPG